MIKLLAFIAFLNSHSSYQGAAQLPPRELMCLSTAVYHEARGEPLIGQVGVAHVILNRVNSSRFPDTVYKVVYQPKQFTDVEKAKPDTNSYEWGNAVEAAVLSYIGFVDDPTNGADHYYAPPWWVQHKEETCKIVRHTFLK